MLYLLLVKEDYSIYFKKRSAMQGVFLLTTQHKRKTMVEHIQIKGVIPRIQYIADGTTTEFEFPFAIFKSDNLTVYLNDILQDSSTYQVNGAEDTDGRSIVFTVPPSVSTQVTLCRNLKVERLSDFQEGVTLRANVLNNELDYQTACIQELAENINRSMVLPPYAADTDVDLTLPPPQAGKAIVWNTAGTNLENSTVCINELENTLRTYKEITEEKSQKATTASQIATEQAQEAIKQAENASLSASLSAFEKRATNCFIEIPQDINVALSGGTITLKKGSKIYLPTGNNVYQPRETASDLILSSVDSGTYTAFIFYQNNTLVSTAVDCCYSGTTAPSVTTTKAVWLDTSSYTFKETTNTGTSWLNSESRSLPLCLISVTNGSITEINQVFNGFGHIGRTSFILPGCKALVSDGRNENGTLKNIIYTTPYVMFHQKDASWTQKQYCYIDTGNNIIRGHADYNVFIQEEKPSNTAGLWYKPSENRWYALDGGIVPIILTTQETLLSGVITEQKVPETFKTLSYEDREDIAGWMIPDYDSAISLSSGTYNFGFDAYGSVFIASQGNTNVSVSINGRKIGVRGNSNSYYSPNSVDFWLPKHSTLKIEGNPTSDSFYCPLKGKK